MLGSKVTCRSPDTAEERAKKIFTKMDLNGDGCLTEEEFLTGCLNDEDLSRILLAGSGNSRGQP